MVDATVSIAIEKLASFLTQEINTRLGVKDGIRWLKDELSYLQSSVRYAEARQDEELIRIWINNVKEVADDALKILERFIASQEEHALRKRNFLESAWSSICICRKEANLYDIGKEIESIKEIIIGIKNRREEYDISNILATSNVQPRKRTFLRATSFENHVDVVGFEDDFKTLLAVLCKEDTSVSMIAIHGMGGLGKSTLAGKLYHSSQLSHFSSRAWVCVSEDYSIENVLRKIIKSLKGHDQPDSLQKMDEVDLLRCLHDLLLDSNCYLVVIDDIWDIKVWTKIKKAFPEKNGSRFIITTRNKKVAEGVDDKCFVHQLRFLRFDESWQLFCKRAKPKKNLEKIGKEMVGKCRGLPLAIEVLSGLLLHKNSYEDWSKVKDHIWRHLKDDSVEIQEILSLSYDDLSFQMKKCFLYLARFLEDHTFLVDKLMRLLIAEEFVSEAVEGDGLFMENVAEDCLIELVNRNMIQIAEYRFNGQLHMCRMHDLVRDLAIQKAREHKLLDIFDSSKQNPNPSLLREIPRHAIHKGFGEYLLLGPSSDDSKLRSLALLDETNSSVKIEVIKLTFTRFKYLKVLDFTLVESDEIPQEIGDLVLLKFLGLMGNRRKQVIVIPPTLGNLTKLQTLCGEGSSQYKVPKEICELKELRHLSSLNCDLGLDAGRLNIGRDQTKLQTLEMWWYENWIQIDTVNFTNLHTLSITDEAAGEYSLDSVANLTSLQSFCLGCFCDNLVPTLKPLSSCKRLNYVLLRCKINDASDLKFLPDSVTYLTLEGTRLRKDPMPILGNLSNLTSLHLIGAYTGQKMVCDRNSFPSLQFLKLEYLSNIKEWQVKDGALYSLKGLDRIGCKNLTMVPPRVKKIPPVPDSINLRASM